MTRWLELLRTMLWCVALGANTLALLACCFFPGASGAGPAGSGGAAGSGTPPPIAATAPPPPPGSAAVLTLVSVVLPTDKENGQPWDVGGGAPDPFVVIRQDGFTLATTARVQDSLSARWEMSVPFDRARPLEIQVFDGDIAADDPVAAITIPYHDAVVHQDLTWWGGSLHTEVR